MSETMRSGLEKGAMLNAPGTGAWWLLAAYGRHSETGREFAVLKTEDGRLAWAIDRETLASWRPRTAMPELGPEAGKIGGDQRWKHFKGGEYVTWGVVQDADTGEDLVVYQPEGGEEIWLRPLKMWFEPAPTGEARFTRIKPALLVDLSA